LEFLTVLRLRSPVVAAEVLRSSQAFFPLVGLVLGILAQPIGPLASGLAGD
jgi:cobalamin synthase